MGRRAPRESRRPSWSDNVALRLRFEREARQRGYAVVPEFTRAPRRVSYRVPIDVPEFDDRRELRIVLPADPRRPPQVFVNGPPCHRHRYPDESLCMWWPDDGAEHRWVTDDGLYALIELAVEHVYCETLCRHGESWPKPEAPTRHPESCPSCQNCP